MTENTKNTEIPIPIDSNLTIGERIQKARKKLGLSAEELAIFTGTYDSQELPESERGISLPTIYRYEKSERDPGAREIKLLCRALNVSADWLIFGEAWDSELEADAVIARGFKSLIKMSSETAIHNALSRNRSRQDWHQIKLSELKNKSKKS